MKMNQEIELMGEALAVELEATEVEQVVGGIHVNTMQQGGATTSGNTVTVNGKRDSDFIN